MLSELRRWPLGRPFLLLLFFVAASGSFLLLYLSFFCSGCGLVVRSASQVQTFLGGRVTLDGLHKADLERDYSDFDPEGERDVLVYLHIQKTGGTTFERHLVRNIELETPCKCEEGRKQCNCKNKRRHLWLFSRFSAGWRCGLHADWTELKNCVQDYIDKQEGPSDQRRYLYATILRDPYYRYLSEWQHVQRGATWLSARLKCNGREATLEEVPFCFDGEDWSGVTLEDFLACPHNLAANRQTRMLANLSLVGCYNTSFLPPAERDRRMLESALHNLRQMAFFGLTEFQDETQYLFEHTFGLHFHEDFMQDNSSRASRAVPEDPALHHAVLEANHLDEQLYHFAKDLFLQRLQHARSQDRTTGQGHPDREEQETQ